MSGRLAIVTKSPLRAAVTDSHMGGFTAARLRWAGFDGLLIEGQAWRAGLPGGGKRHGPDRGTPPHLWGLGGPRCGPAGEGTGRENTSVMAIGPAGGTVARVLAGWLDERDRASGGGGAGAVGGSKNLKAIVIIGDRSRQPQPLPERKEAFQEAVRMGQEGDRGRRAHGGQQGRSVAVPHQRARQHPQPDRRPAHAQREGEPLPARGGHRRRGLPGVQPRRRAGCRACPVHCKQAVEVQGRPLESAKTESMEYETAWAFGALCGLNDLEPPSTRSIGATSTGSTRSRWHDPRLAMETSRGPHRRKASTAATAAAMSEMIRKIAKREGFGAASPRRGTAPPESSATPSSR